MNRRPQSRVFTPNNPMAKILGGEGAPTVEDMVRDSTQRVASMQDLLDTYVAEQIDIILRLVDRPDSEVFLNRHAVATAAIRLAEVAGATRPTPLRMASKGIAVLLNHLDRQGRWRPDVLRIHVAALKLAADAHSSASIELMFRELVRMRDALGVDE